jgi:hypothetical protein
MFRNAIPYELHTERMILVCPVPEKADDFIIELLSDHEKAAKYLPFFYKGPKGWSKLDAQ